MPVVGRAYNEHTRRRQQNDRPLGRCRLLRKLASVALRRRVRYLPVDQARRTDVNWSVFGTAICARQPPAGAPGPVLQSASGAERRGLVTAPRGLPAVVSARSHTGHTGWWRCPPPLLAVLDAKQSEPVEVLRQLQRLGHLGPGLRGEGADDLHVVAAECGRGQRPQTHRSQEDLPDALRHSQ